MSTIKVDTIKSRTDTAPTLAKGVNVTGIGTASHGLRATTGGLNVVAGVSTFGGNVSISGVLTYEDVTNVDSLGIITARNGFRATAGGINVVSGVSTFANQIDANGCIDATGIITASHGSRITAGGLNIVSGVSTFANQVDANGSVDVAGIVTASHGFRATTGGINIVAGVSTVKEDAIFSATTGTGTTIGLGGINVSGIVTAYHGFDGAGNVPASTTTGTYALDSSDAGKLVLIDNTCTLPASKFVAGDAISVYNNTGGNLTLTCSAPTAVYLGSDGSTKTSLTLATHCICTFVCVNGASNGTFVATGGGLS